MWRMNDMSIKEVNISVNVVCSKVRFANAASLFECEPRIENGIR